MWVTLNLSQSGGTTPSSKQLLETLARGCASLSLNSFKNLAQILSGPVLSLASDFKSFSVPSSGYLCMPGNGPSQLEIYY